MQGVSKGLFDKKVLDDIKDACSVLYTTIVETLQDDLIQSGVDKATARKQARGAARGVLGNALATELVWSANVRALRHFIGLRGSGGADAEIRMLAHRLWCIMKAELPAYFSDFEETSCADGVTGVSPIRKI
jgi:thymidylate synthase (FAD)